ncbi:MAG TPA: hypothetical protein VGP73_25250 [Thermoanaerobaculia bacterium]
MTERHPDPQALQRFAVGEVSTVESAEIERHLVVCTDCRDRVDEAVGRVSLPLFQWLGSDYDEALDRAVLGAAERLAGLRREARGAEDLLAELLREPEALRQGRIREDERFHSVKLCELLRTRGRERWLSDPAESLDLAELAVGVAERLDPGRYGAMLVENARALSWAYLGNSLRLKSDLWRAEQAFKRSWGHHRSGGGDPYTEGELLFLTSSLRIVQSRSREAVRLTDQAAALYRAIGEVQSEGSALINKGLALSKAGLYEEAVEATRSGLLRSENSKDPHLLLAAKHNLVFFYLLQDDPEKAGRLLVELRSLYDETAKGALPVRLWWVEGRFAGHLGRFTDAESHLIEVRDFFLDLDLGIELFYAALDLAELYARSGRPRQVRETLGEVIPLGEALGLRRETLMARLLYEQASRASR